jgi:hypothetical protein
MDILISVLVGAVVGGSIAKFKPATQSDTLKQLVENRLDVIKEEAKRKPGLEREPYILSEANKLNKFIADFRLSKK